MEWYDQNNCGSGSRKEHVHSQAKLAEADRIIFPPISKHKRTKVDRTSECFDQTVQAFKRILIDENAPARYMVCKCSKQDEEKASPPNMAQSFLESPIRA